jgi:phosphoglycolate phosphatase-like HAD superfamily hydrolase
MPLLHAAALAGISPAECIYVGDAQRDVQAAHAAGMPALVANYGYLRADEDAASWGGDGYLNRPLELLDWLQASGRL